MTGSDQESEDSESEFAEKDPAGRYGRYKDVLGKGAFKTVYKAFDELEGIEVAWNQVNITDCLRSSEDLERLYSEVHLLRTLKHKNIIKMYSSWVDSKKGTINFITEVFTSGTLRQYRKKHKHVDLRALKNWSRQILMGLAYLHSHDPPVIHRDLKCDNIFVNGNQGEVKIGDLGLAAILRQATAAHSVIGTPEFMAPELYEEEYNELVDIYAFGMCLLELVTLEYPYIECSNAAQIYKKVTTGIKPLSLNKVKDADVKLFIEKCIADASKRLSADDLLNDPFLHSGGAASIGRSLHSAETYDGNNRSLPQSDQRINKQEMRKEGESSSSLSHVNPTTDNYRALSNDGAQSSLDNTKDPGNTSNRDFSVRGQIEGDNTVFLSLRIEDSTGHVRNIHFPFDIEADTAIGVASEMVTELSLTDHDVTAIADMIDKEILLHIPDWLPEESFEHNLSGEQEPLPVEDVGEDADHTPAMPIEEEQQLSALILERLPSGRKYWTDSPKGDERSPTASPQSFPTSQPENGEFSDEFEESTFAAGSSKVFDSLGSFVLSPIPEHVVQPAVLDTESYGENAFSFKVKQTSASQDSLVDVKVDNQGLHDQADHLGSESGSYAETHDVVSPDGRSVMSSPEESLRISLEGESDEARVALQKLIQLRMEQQKEVEMLKKKHDFAISQFLTGFPLEFCERVLGVSQLKSHDHSQMIGSPNGKDLLSGSSPLKNKINLDLDSDSNMPLVEDTMDKGDTLSPPVDEQIGHGSLKDLSNIHVIEEITHYEPVNGGKDNHDVSHVVSKSGKDYGVENQFRASFIWEKSRLLKSKAKGPDLGIAVVLEEALAKERDDRKGKHPAPS